MKGTPDFFIKYRMFIWPAISGLAAIVILVLVIIPQLADYFRIQNQISEIQKRTSRLEAKAQELDSLDGEAYKRNLQVVLTVLPAARNVPQAILVLQDLISKAGLRLTSTSYSMAVRSGTKNSFQLNVAVLGSLTSLRSFLIDLQETERIFQVESINTHFQRSGQVIEAEVPLAVFYGPPPTTAGSLDQEIPKLNPSEEQLLSNLTRFIAESQARGAIGEASASAIPLGKPNPFE